MMLLKFYKTIFTLVISLLIFGFFINLISNNSNPYAAMGLQRIGLKNNNPNEVLSVLDVNKYVEYSEETLNITDSILNDDAILSNNITSAINNSSNIEEINEHMDKYKSKLDNIMNTLS